MAFCLSLSGGGARGAAHVGVLKALEEEGLRPKAISGASAGAIVGALYAYGITIGEMEALVDHLSKKGGKYVDADFFGIIKLIFQVILRRDITLSGIIKGEKLERLFCDITDDVCLESLCMKLLIPTVDLNEGKTVVYTNMRPKEDLPDVIWKNCGRLCQIIRASSSVPGLFRPVHLDGYCLVDGGLTNNLPVDLLKATGENNILAVDIGAEYESPDNDGIIEVLTHSFSIMSHSLKECTSMSEDFLLNPKLPKEAGLLSFKKMNECMAIGYEYTKKIMPTIKKNFK